MASTSHMPARGERSAPTFDKTKPRELPRFFDELEYLFERTELTVDADQKRQVLRYVDFEVEQIWKTLREYTDPEKTYDDFKNAILAHYPDASGDYVYSLSDLDLLLGERQRLGMSTTTELADYHLKFLAITSWLVDKQLLGDLEQKRYYLRGFQQPFCDVINNRLQLKFPDHHPNKPHTMQDVYEAARFIIQSATSPVPSFLKPKGVRPTQVPVESAPPVTILKKEPPVKTEGGLESMFSEFTKTIVEAINQSSRARPSTQGFAPRFTDCNFCGGPHFIRECLIVDDYIRAGKCMRNDEGKVVLPNGNYVSREIPGKTLQERVEEWHRRNPNNLGAAITLLHTIKEEALALAQIHSTDDAETVYQLSRADRIATLEAELFNLRTRKIKFVPAVRT